MSSTVIRLWSGDAPGALGDRPCDIPTLTYYPATASHTTGATVVIFPGGGYAGLAPHEGEGYARWLNAHGMAAHVLQYRLGSDGYRHPCMLQDAARAIRLARQFASDQGRNPNLIGVMGSSAGGHLAATIMTKYDAGQPDAPEPVDRISSRPDFGILCYPVVTFAHQYAHGGSCRYLLGENASSALKDELSADLHVTPQTPPAYIWHTVADASVPMENSMIFAAALRQAGVPFALSIYENGAHGLGLGSPERPAPPWATDCLHWLRERGLATPV